jgi:hypothetical protein
MKGLQRQTWQHGCADPHACGDRYHKIKPCPKNCKRHKRECPPPCPPDCASHARWCPQRHDGGLVEVEVKSAAGRRGIALPDQLFVLITEHRKRQDHERDHAGTEWHEGGWMFTQPTGKPIDPRRDQYEWKALLEEAGVREARLHDAPHSGHNSAAPWRPGTSRDGCHGLVECRHGQAVRPRHRTAAPGHRRPAEHVPLDVK